ncbi:type II secretion system protein GspL [Cupriavidus basilensis]
MVTDRAWLRAVLDAFAEQRYRRRHVLPAQLCLQLPVAAAETAADVTADTPATDTTAMAALAPEAATLISASPLFETEGVSVPADISRYWQLTVRSSEYAGYGLLLDSTRWHLVDSPRPATGTPSAEAMAQAWRSQGAHPLDWKLWIEGAQASLHDPSLDLAQFEFAQGRADRWNLKRLARLPVALAAGLVLIQMIGMNVQWLLLHQEQQRLVARQEETLRSTFPQIPVVIDPPLQMRRQVDQLRLASGRSTPDDFLAAGRPLRPGHGASLRRMHCWRSNNRGHTPVCHAQARQPTPTRCAVRRASAGLAMEADNSPPDAARGNAPAGTRWSIKPNL